MGDRGSMYRLSLLVLLCAWTLPACDSARTPAIKWAQDDKELWITVLVPGLEEYEVELTDDALLVELQDEDGDEFVAELQLREYVRPKQSSWKHTPGTAALYITLTKVHEHFWDALVEPGCASAIDSSLIWAGGPTRHRMMTPETWRTDWPDQSN